MPFHLALGAALAMHRFADSRSGPWLSESLGDGAQLLDEPVTITRQRYEVVALVEARRTAVDGVDHGHLPASGTGCAQCGLQPPDEKLGAQTLTVVAPVEGELGEEDCRDVAGRAAANSERDLLAFDEVRSEGEVSSDLLAGIVDEDVRARPLGRGVTRMELQPLIQFGVSAVEVVELVMFAERFDPKCHLIRGRRRAR
jgi:hypothetical protein